MSTLFSKPTKVINVGMAAFKDTMDRTGTPCIQVEWRPPIGVSAEALATIARHRTCIDEANKKALQRVLEGKPVLMGLGLAKDLIPGMAPDLFLHAGPPVTWERMCGPMRGAMIGAMMYEGRAKTTAEAEAMLSSGKVRFKPCHECSTVGPMAGIVSSSMPVFIVKNETFGNISFATMNEGLGKVLRYGAFSPEVVTRLKWMETVMYPVLAKAIEAAPKIDLRGMIAQALHMGDEVHNRNRAATSLLFRHLAPFIMRTAEDRDAGAKVLEFINGNDHFFLNLSMAASKAILDAARDIPDSSMAVVMARNGTDFGVQLSGTGNKWFVGPADVPDALYFPGYSKADANPDIGDSAITETAGLGGFSIAAAPAIVQFVGGTPADALNYTRKMYEITLGENSAWRLPSLDFRGAPTGIDVTRIVATGILPFIDTGVAHKDPGVGQVGAGVLSAPAEPFKQAVEGLAAVLR